MADNEKYKGKYRIPSARWATWDYGANAGYFVTICTANKRCYFGTIANNLTVETHDHASHNHASHDCASHNHASQDNTKTETQDLVPKTETQDLASLPDFAAMHYSSLGLAAVDCWLEIPSHFPFVELGEFVVMPNHVHGILMINKQDFDTPVETHDHASHDHASPDLAPEPETQDLASLRTVRDQPVNKFGPQSRNLASIVRGFKIGVTKFARQNGLPFEWQPRFHDRVIRSEAEFEKICRYVRDNVPNWGKDEFYVA